MGPTKLECIFGTLLVACKWDVESYIFLIAFAVVESRNRDNWSLFLVQCKMRKSTWNTMSLY